MRPLLNFAFRVFHWGLLCSASLLVPAAQRAEWQHEWSAELWHVRHSCIPMGIFSWQAQREVTAFCLGSFSDAFCLRRVSLQSGAIAAPVHSSAWQCVLWLSAALALCAVLARLLPGVCAEADTVRYRVSPGLILIQDAGLNVESAPSVSVQQFRGWQRSHQRYFDGLAFYRSTHERAAISDTHAIPWRVAHTSFNLLDLLGVPVQFTQASTANDREFPAVILSHETWARDFSANPHIAGRLIRIGGHKARIAGVLPCGSWRLPSHPDVWLLESDTQLASSSTDRLGFVLAHLSPLGQTTFTDHMTITVRSSSDSNPNFYGVWFGDHTDEPLKIYAFALFLALLALPAVTSMSMSESSFSSYRPGWKHNLYRWLFLAAKLALVSAITYFASLDIAYGPIDTYSQTAEFLQFVSGFSIGLFGLRWALLDQQQRCPVCLRRVTHPAQVGLASQTFLGWNGTEMMCPGGHTLLHVPSLATSWFGAQRWLYLDTSWEFLFAGSGVK